MNETGIALGALALSIIAGTTSAGTVPVPYTGSYDEALVPADTTDGLPAGDFDTIDGIDDVALFQLVEGTNTFTGSIFSSQDPADSFNVEILSGFRLTGASIDWGTNLSGLSFTIPVPSGYLQQTSFVGGLTPPDPALFSAPRWRVSPVEEGSTQIVVDRSGS
jgi:hypothetical protein